MKVWIVEEWTVDDTTTEVWATEERANEAAKEAFERLCDTEPDACDVFSRGENGVWEGESGGNPWRVEVTETEVRN